MTEELPLCECGCGNNVRESHHNFIHGHNQRGKKRSSETISKMIKTKIAMRPPKPEPTLCECGCGEYAKSGMKFIHGHNTKKRFEDPTERARTGDGVRRAHLNDLTLSQRRSESQQKRRRDNPVSEETKERQSIGIKNAYKEHPEYWDASDEAIINRSNGLKKAYSNDPTIKDRISDGVKLAHINDPTLSERKSAAMQGIPYNEWEEFAKDKLYCPEFDESCRESNRDKYGRRCFLCEKSESLNYGKNKKAVKLSVHHVDMNKNQGCDDHKWKLVPLCMKCHGKRSHSDMWQARIEYLLMEVY